MPREVLPTHLEPVHYDLVLTPNIAEHTFTGVVNITCNVHDAAATTKVSLNAKDLTISSFTLNGVSNTGVVLDDETATATFASPVDSSSKTAVISVSFAGSINDKMCGFYRSSIPESSVCTHRVMGVTQFESVDARRAFPCFDEPALKATFTVSIKDLPAELTALSNMPVAKVTEDGGKKSWEYEKTPAMSTYLVAWAIAEMDYVEAKTKAGVTVRVYTRKGVAEQGQFALDVAARTLDYFSEYFGTPYALPKLDLVAVPDFAMGAMENWGLTTYREVALLYNSKTTSAAGMQRIAYIVGHELAHQWFGNIVTMKWWSDLWLNEGFATWAGWLVVHEFFPSWNVWDQFQTSSYESALKLDALVSSHPIEVDVNKAREIDDIFDAISYCKGASAIRMLVAHMGEAVFQAGIKEYVKAHAYGNASTLDLWSQLARSSGKDISGYMDTWTKKTGYPLVTVTAPAIAGGAYTVRQQRFLADPNLPADTSVVWPVPLRLAYLGPGDKVVVEEVLMTSLEHSFTLPEGAVAVKVNFGQYGFFRTLYSQDALSALISYGVDKLPVADRAALVSDMDALARCGKARTADALRLLEAFAGETDYSVWYVISNFVSVLFTVWSGEGDELLGQLKRFALSLFGKASAALGWDPRAGDGHLDGLLRSLLVPNVAKYGDAAALEEAVKRFEAGTLSSDVRGGVFAALASNSASFLPKLISVFEGTDDPSIKVACINAFGNSPNPEDVTKMLNYGLRDGKIRSQDYFYVVSSAASNPRGKKAAWEFVRGNWKDICAHLSGAASLIGHCASACISSMTHEETIDEASAFFKENPVDGIAMTISQALEGARARAQWLKRDRESFAAFISKY